MSIKDLSEKIKGFAGSITSRVPTIPDDLFLGLIIILVAFGSFGLGRLSKIEGSKTPIRIENAPMDTQVQFPGNTSVKPQNSAQKASLMDEQETQLVASKSGKKYYYPWCSGVQKIAEANRIYFATKEEAVTRGYTPSATCKGL